MSDPAFTCPTPSWLHPLTPSVDQNCHFPVPKAEVKHKETKIFCSWHCSLGVIQGSGTGLVQTQIIPWENNGEPVSTASVKISCPTSGFSLGWCH